MSQTVELPRVGGPGSGVGGLWRVVVLNDVTLAQGYRLADRIHKSGCAIVWSGPRDEAEGYWVQLEGAGLTMAPLEEG